MKELYSNANDCYKLACLLKNRLKGKIEFSGSTFQELIIGNYHLLPRNKYESFLEYGNDVVEFSYKFLENGFLRISVCDSAYKKASIGQKLAVLSDLYEVLSKEYGLPLVFYTLKDDDLNSINLEWDFIQKEETIDVFKNGSMIDAEVDELIIIGEEDEKTTCYSLSSRTKELISKTIGLPYEMIYLVDENIEDFVFYKKGERMSYREDAKVDGYSITTPEEIDKRIDEKVLSKKIK